jgi:hypothetical protein
MVSSEERLLYISVTSTDNAEYKSVFTNGKIGVIPLPAARKKY